MRVNMSRYWSKRVVETTYQGFSPHDVCGQMARQSSVEEDDGAPDVDLRSAAGPLHIVTRACSTRLRTADNQRAAPRILELRT